MMREVPERSGGGRLRWRETDSLSREFTMRSVIAISGGDLFISRSSPSLQTTGWASIRLVTVGAEHAFSLSS
jgi:hypothetical protein